jgi:plasmid replication initiation protein
VKRNKTLGEQLGFMENHKIRNRKELNATLMTLNTPAKRLTYFTMIQLPFDEKNKTLIFEENKTYRIYAKEFSTICGISLSQGYKQLKEGVEELQKTIVRIPKSVLGDDLDFQDTSDDFIVMFSVADYCGYSEGEGYVDLRFHRKMKPLIAELERNFTTQYLLSAVRLPIGNANNFYLLLREKISDGMKYFFDIEFEELKEKLLIKNGGIYDSYMRFNNNYFQQSSKQIIEKTEFTHLSIEIIGRVKRKAHKLRISYKLDKKQPKTLKEAVKLQDKNTKASKKKESEKKVENELRQFGIKWLNKQEAESLHLDWSDGLTSKEAVKKNTKSKK